jgi:hypothetical protein
MYLRGALDSAKFFHHMRKQLSSIKMPQENLADIRHKLSIIYKHIQSMHNELRYQAKIHIISEKLSKEKKKKIMYLLPPTSPFLKLKKNKTKTTKTYVWKKEIISSPSM